MHSDQSQDTSPDLLAGQSFADRYEVLSLIGRGGFGAVYKARHTLIGRTVAIKVLHEPAPNSVLMRRFQVEAQAAANLTHPNIVTVYDFGASATNQLYLIMDFVEGTSLSDVLAEEGHLGVDRALNIFIQSCEALDHAHRRGIIHRDLKPSNIMLTHNEGSGDFVKIVDFGLAKLMAGSEQNEKLTQSGDLLGTPFYMSPEQCLGEELDSRCDIYSLGCIMYRVLCGTQPIHGKNVLSTLYQQISKDPPSFAESAPELRVPSELERIVFKTLKKDPAARHQSMAELAADLRNVQDSRTGGRSRGRQLLPAGVRFALPARRLLIAASIVLLAAASAATLRWPDQLWQNTTLPTPDRSPTAADTLLPETVQTIGKTLDTHVTGSAHRRQPRQRLASPGQPYSGYVPAPGFRSSGDFPPPIAPNRISNDMPASQSAVRGADGSGNGGPPGFAQSASAPSGGPWSVADRPGSADEAQQQLDRDRSGSPAASYARGSGRKSGKRSRLVRAIGSFADKSEQLLKRLVSEVDH